VEAVIYLDTNVLLWLAGAPEQLSPSAKAAIDEHELLLFSPMVELEVEFLYEIGRIQRPATEVITHLRGVLNLKACDRSFASVAAKARELKWTRDPFDRLIAAQAALGADALLTRDKIIRANYPHAIW
jgi:PIN domain nuclease of toxin-antitoxin system